MATTVTPDESAVYTAIKAFLAYILPDATPVVDPPEAQRLLYGL